MILPYFLRLLCLCFASFFVLNAAAGLLVGIASKSALRFADSRTPGAAAGFLLALRVLPLVIASSFVFGLCVPSYLSLEPALTSEHVSILCLILGLLGALTWFLSVVRSTHSLFASMRHNRLCLLASQEMCLSGRSCTLLVVENETPLLALSGLLRPRLLVSRGVLRVLSAEELDAALSHEHAHRTSRDNAKRLLLLLAPDIFPFVRTLHALERSWSKFAEWAADDQAAAGDSRRAVSLAAALVRVARLGSSPRLPHLSTSLLAGDFDLSARVDRLLQASPETQATHARPPYPRPLFRGAGLLFVGGLALLLFTPPALSFVHGLLELLLH
ncbi:MAG: M56 family metallopeptidase [Candidatus Acidiferrum sp.]